MKLVKRGGGVVYRVSCGKQPLFPTTERKFRVNAE